MRKTARQIHAAGDVMASPRARACAKASATASLATSGSCANAHAARQIRSPCVRYSASIALRFASATAASTKCKGSPGQRKVTFAPERVLLRIRLWRHLSAKSSRVQVGPLSRGFGLQSRQSPFGNRPLGVRRASVKRPLTVPTSQSSGLVFRFRSKLIRLGSLYNLCWPDHVKLVYWVERLGCPVSLASAMLEQLGQSCSCTNPKGEPKWEGSS